MIQSFRMGHAQNKQRQAKTSSDQSHFSIPRRRGGRGGRGNSSRDSQQGSHRGYQGGFNNEPRSDHQGTQDRGEPRQKRRREDIDSRLTPVARQPDIDHKADPVGFMLQLRQRKKADAKAAEETPLDAFPLSEVDQLREDNNVLQKQNDALRQQVTILQDQGRGHADDIIRL